MNRPHKLNRALKHTGYRFQDRDPAMEELCDLIDKSGLSTRQIAETVYKATHGSYTIGHGTVERWLNGKTRRPSNFTMTWVGYALGYQRKWTKL